MPNPIDYECNRGEPSTVAITGRLNCTNKLLIKATTTEKCGISYHGNGVQVKTTCLANPNLASPASGGQVDGSLYEFEIPRGSLGVYRLC